MEDMGKSKQWFFKKINKIDKPLARYRKKRWIFVQPNADQ